MSGTAVGTPAWCLVCAAAGLAAGRLGVFVFNAVPARWLCDYGETPGPEILSRRLSPKTHGRVLGAGFAAVFLLFHFQYPASSPSFYLLCLAAFPLALAALADLKYRIIPDQCLPAVAVPAAANLACGLVFGGTFYKTAVSPFLGALCGGTLWVLLGLLGRLLYRRESVGFGDIKLFAVLGFLCGFPEVISVFILTILLAGVHFSILLLAKKVGPEQALPMGPYICAACLAALAFRSQIAAGARWYLSLF
jgi:leader peptidase (prepilin peptidase) / N-methyltransferase